MERKTAYSTGFAQGRVTRNLGTLCFYSSSVLDDSLVLRNPPERKARKRLAMKKPPQNQKVFGGLPKKNLKYEILKKLILVFPQTDVTSHLDRNLCIDQLT